jgi:hypothetical protein
LPYSSILKIDVIPSSETSVHIFLITRYYNPEGRNLSLIYVRFEVFTAVTVKNVVFWGVALHTPADAGSPFADFSTLKMEAIRSSETSVNPGSTQRHIPEDEVLHSHRCENLKSYKGINCYTYVIDGTPLKSAFPTQRTAI